MREARTRNRDVSCLKGSTIPQLMGDQRVLWDQAITPESKNILPTVDEIDEALYLPRDIEWNIHVKRVA